MTISTTTSVPAAWLHGTRSSVTSRPELFVVYEGALTQPAAIAGATTLADYARGSEAQPGRAEALAAARKRLAGDLAASPLAALRLQAGLSQQQVADRMGVSQPQVARCEQGRHDPSTETVARLAKALDAPLAEVFLATREGLRQRSER